MCDRNTNTSVKDKLDKSDKKGGLNELMWKLIILERFDLKYELLLIRRAAVKGLASYCKAETTFTFHFSILTL